MRITQISLSFTETCNLGDYSNTKPSIELTALLDAGDDVHAVINELVTKAKGVIHEKVDEELELANRSVKYYAGPTYDVVYSYGTKWAAIIPADFELAKLPGRSTFALKKVRHAAAVRRAKRELRELPEGACLFDCSDGDINALIAYDTEQQAHNDAAAAERRRLDEEAIARRKAEWEAQQRPTDEEEEDDEEDEEFYDEEDSE